MKKRKRILILLLMGLGGMALVHAGPEETIAPPRQEVVLGERLVYKITWLKIPVGIGEVWVKEKTTLGGREVIHVAGSIETNKVLNKIFPMHDEAHSWMDARTFESVQFEKNVDEPFINEHDRTVFDREKGKGYLESFKTGKKSEFKVAVPVHDVLSAFFWARRQVSDPDQTVQIVLTADQADWELEIPGFSRETVKIDGNKIPTLRVEPVTRSGGKERRGKAWFNVTTDASRKPVRIVYKAPFGRVVGTLIETEFPAGNSYPAKRNF